MSDLPVSTVVRCPGCGAEIAFRVGSSRVLVCEYCSFAVARTDTSIENIGRVAAVIPTGSHLSLRTRGSFQGRGFTLVGRIQLDWGQGRWDEWYAAFDDGQWGWLAEAAGHFYFSFRVDNVDVPTVEHPEHLAPGQPFEIPDMGRFVVSDRKQPRYVGARGELPELIPLDGTAFTSVDLSGAHDTFATLDFSDNDQLPTIYVGREVSLEALAIDTSAADPIEAQRGKAVALTCPQCHAPIALRVPDQAKRVTCDHCNALLDVTQGHLRYLDVIVEKASFRFKLGRKATFFGVEYITVGWLQRGCTFGTDHYSWEEYLLYDPKHARYRFLVLSEGHWSFVTPIGAGGVSDFGQTVMFHAKSYKRFATTVATVERVHGEFYWEVAEGEAVRATDYIAPPEGLSCEAGRDEVNWSHAVYVTPQEVEKAFAESRPLVRPRRVGSLQPNRIATDFFWRLLFGSLGIAFLMMLFFHIYAGHQEVFSSNLAAAAPPVDEHAAPPAASDAQPTGETAGAEPAPAEETTPAEPDPEAGTYQTAVLFTEPIEFPLDHRNLQVEFSSNARESWVGLDAALIHDETNDVYSFGMESSYYNDDGEIEDHREASTYLSSLPSGHYILRAELTWPKNVPRPEVRLTMTSGVARNTHFMLALLALFVVPLIAFGLSYSFEKARWEEGTESP